jgi:hypothetical protein
MGQNLLRQRPTGGIPPFDGMSFLGNHHNSAGGTSVFSRRFLRPPQAKLGEKIRISSQKVMPQSG